MALENTNLKSENRRFIDAWKEQHEHDTLTKRSNDDDKSNNNNIDNKMADLSFRNDYLIQQSMTLAQIAPNFENLREQFEFAQDNAAMASSSPSSSSKNDKNITNASGTMLFDKNNSGLYRSDNLDSAFDMHSISNDDLLMSGNNARGSGMGIGFDDTCHTGGSGGVKYLSMLDTPAQSVLNDTQSVISCITITRSKLVVLVHFMIMILLAIQV